VGNNKLTVIGRQADTPYKIKPQLDSAAITIDRLDKLIDNYKYHLPLAEGLFKPNFDDCVKFPSARGK
jgi:hypothetical protein